MFYIKEPIQVKNLIHTGKSIHRDKKHYLWDVYEKAFSDTVLVRHKMIHTDEKPYEFIKYLGILNFLN